MPRAGDRESAAGGGTPELRRLYEDFGAEHLVPLWTQRDQVAPNASRVLDRPGVLDRVIEVGVLPRRLTFRSAVTGRELAALDVGEPFRRRYGAPVRVTGRPFPTA